MPCASLVIKSFTPAETSRERFIFRTFLLEGRLMEFLLRRNHREGTVLVATSGDTGSAAIGGTINVAVVPVLELMRASMCYVMFVHRRDKYAWDLCMYVCVCPSASRLQDV